MHLECYIRRKRDVHTLCIYSAPPCAGDSVVYVASCSPVASERFSDVTWTAELGRGEDLHTWRLRLFVHHLFCSTDKMRAAEFRWLRLLPEP